MQHHHDYLHYINKPLFYQKTFKTFNTKKSALSQHVMDFDHRIDWDNVKTLKSESHAYRRRVAESFLIKQKARSCNVINRNDGANVPAVYSVFVSNVLFILQQFVNVPTPGSVM